MGDGGGLMVPSQDPATGSRGGWLGVSPFPGAGEAGLPAPSASIRAVPSPASRPGAGDQSIPVLPLAPRASGRAGVRAALPSGVMAGGTCWRSAPHARPCRS